MHTEQQYAASINAAVPDVEFPETRSDSPGVKYVAFKQVKDQRDKLQRELEEMRSDALRRAQRRDERFVLAGCAMQGLLACKSDLDSDEQTWEDFIATLSEEAVQIADTLLAELDKPTKGEVRDESHLHD